MKRRTLDFLFSAGGVALAALFLILGLVMTSNANFSKRYVRDQLHQQQEQTQTFHGGRLISIARQHTYLREHTTHGLNCPTDHRIGPILHVNQGNADPDPTVGRGRRPADQGA